MAEPLPPLADEDDLATKLGVPATDGKLQLALKRASDRFRGAVGHPVTQVEDDIIELDGNGSHSLLLPAAPIIGTPVVTVDGAAVTDFSVSRSRGMLRRRGCVWPDDLGNIEVTYTHGYDQIPGDIEDAVLEQAELQFQILAGVAQMSLGSESFAFGAQATVGTTQRWSDAVARYQIGRGDRS
jgi:hypothetical protein